MYHFIKSLRTKDNHILIAIFKDGVEKQYDIRQLYEELPQFKVFEEDDTLFNSVILTPGGYGVYWNDNLDLDAEEIWYSGIPTGVVHDISDMEAMAVNLTYARAALQLSQLDLANLTGISQGDICKIECCKANPTFKTLKRLADAMNMQLKIEFVPKG